MAIFSWKSKGKKEEQKQQDSASPAESQPSTSNKHISKHAAADALDQEGRTEGLHRNPKQTPMFDTFYAQEASSNMAHGASTPSSFSRKNHSNETFTTHSNDFFAPSAMRKLQANDPSLGYAKVAIARQDQGLAHYASDSGYESAGPSRVPSEQNLDEMSSQYLSRPNIPDLRLNDDIPSEVSSKSAAKKTRFQVDSETVSSTEQLPARTMNLAALEGFKVNKKGKVLDEEGDVIGELVDGDLLDCVRQKVNNEGKVVDDQGKIVGTVRIAVAALPSLVIVSPAAGHNADGESSPVSAPRSPTFAHPRPVRSASERSLSELSKPYARPPMSSVPENKVPGDEAPLGSPELFAYKGDIPAGPHQHTRRRSSSPPLLSAPSSVRRPNPRRVSSSGMSARSSGKQPVGYYSSRRGPLSSYDNSPNGSDDGTDTSNSDDGKLPSISYSRPMSVRSAATVPAKHRTYFTHAGRVTVDPNAPDVPLQTQALKPKSAVEPSQKKAPVEKKDEKKKGRLSLRFGKK